MCLPAPARTNSRKIQNKYSRDHNLHAATQHTRPVMQSAAGSCSSPLTLLLGASSPPQSSSNPEKCACERVRSAIVRRITSSRPRGQIEAGRRSLKRGCTPFIPAILLQLEDKQNPSSLFSSAKSATGVQVNRARFDGEGERRWAGQTHLLQGPATLGVQRIVSASRGPRQIALEQRCGPNRFKPWRATWPDIVRGSEA